jgi:hypothetical protein
VVFICLVFIRLARSRYRCKLWPLAVVTSARDSDFVKCFAPPANEQGASQFLSSRTSHDSFPLTPALSLGERENDWHRSKSSPFRQFLERGGIMLPLLGERAG